MKKKNANNIKPFFLQLISMSHLSVDQFIRNGAGRRCSRTLVAVKPACVRQFILLQFQLSGIILRREGEHQLTWERPALAATVTYVFHPDASLLQHLTRHRQLCGLASLHKPGYAGVHVLITLHMPREQNLIPLIHKHNNARLNPWEEKFIAPRAHLCGQRLVVRHQSSALRAKFSLCMPSQDCASSGKRKHKALVGLRKHLSDRLCRKAIRKRAIRKPYGTVAKLFFLDEIGLFMQRFQFFQVTEGKRRAVRADNQISPCKGKAPFLSTTVS